MVYATLTDYLSEEGANSQQKKELPKGAICVSCIATVGKVSIATEPSHTNQQINSIVPSNSEFTPYLYFRMKSLNRLLHELASGGSATLNLNTSSFSKINVIMPSQISLDAYSGLVTPLFNQILSNVENSQSLSSLRDILLPKLLSGEVG